MDLSLSEVADLTPRVRGTTEPTNHPPRHTHGQLEALNALFNKDSKPSAEARRLLAEEIGLTLKQVNNWFQAQKTKLKKEKERGEAVGVPMSQSSTTGSGIRFVQPRTPQNFHHFSPYGGRPLAQPGLLVVPAQNIQMAAPSITPYNTNQHGGPVAPTTPSTSPTPDGLGYLVPTPDNLSWSSLEHNPYPMVPFYFQESALRETAHWEHAKEI